VKISPNYLSLYQYISSLCLPSQHGLSGSGVSSQGVILLWKTRFFAIEMTLVLSHMRGTLSKITPNSLIVCTIRRIWEQQLAAATYSASVVDRGTEDYF
jgi:hypothetical protein